MQNSDSFWSDIKNLEGQLAKSPDSLCFARLAEVYLKVGLIDDALHVARLGTAKHPRYLSGQKALAQACHAKGESAEALAALELVTEALPEDVASQKLLGRLLAGEGRQDDARRAFKTALEFAPDDAECRIELQALERALGVTSADEDDEEIIEDLEILDDIEIVDEDEAEPGFSVAEAAEEQEPAPAAGLVHDPLSTGTLAELYVKQGFIHKALEIYRTILADNPGHAATAQRVAELERLDTPAEVAPAFEYAFEEDTEVEAEVEAEPAVVPAPVFETAPVFEAEPAVAVTPVFEAAPAFEAFEPEPAVEPEPDFVPEPVAEADGSAEGFSPEFQMEPAPEPAQKFTFSALEAVVAESRAALVAPQGVADNALSTLEGWLENIRRIKSCR
jgi:tetratricopeptide (TPR) repeat protein